jgi:uncharacterized membrane protein YsdA (DUF1294 family)
VAGRVPERRLWTPERLWGGWCGDWGDGASVRCNVKRWIEFGELRAMRAMRNGSRLQNLRWD